MPSAPMPRACQRTASAVPAAPVATASAMPAADGSSSYTCVATTTVVKPPAMPVAVAASDASVRPRRSWR
jgi:hypothetical protein